MSNSKWRSQQQAKVRAVDYLAEVHTAVHTAVSELPADTHEDDLLDCVYGMVGQAHYDIAGEDQIREWIRGLR